MQNEETELVQISLPLKRFQYHVVGAVEVVAGAQLCGRDGQSWPDPECGHRGDLNTTAIKAMLVRLVHQIKY